MVPCTCGDPFCGIAELIWKKEHAWPMAMTDGSSMKALLYPDIHLAAFVLECKNRMGRIWGSFPGLSRCGCNYRGELVGLMAIHLIILATNEANAGPTGRVEIRSDCLG
jgi:hypothetical protein